jgi:hypothetical protein
MPEDSSRASRARAGGTDRSSQLPSQNKSRPPPCPPAQLGRTPVRSSPLAFGLFVRNCGIPRTCLSGCLPIAFLLYSGMEGCQEVMAEGLGLGSGSGLLTCSFHVSIWVNHIMILLHYVLQKKLSIFLELVPTFEHQPVFFH